jgi:hypothetical protein
MHFKYQTKKTITDHFSGTKKEEEKNRRENNSSIFLSDVTAIVRHSKLMI